MFRAVHLIENTGVTQHFNSYMLGNIFDVLGVEWFLLRKKQ